MFSSLRFKGTLSHIIHAAYPIVFFPVLVRTFFYVKVFRCIPGTDTIPKMFLNKIRNIFCVPATKFVSATNVARAGNRGNIFVGNNVSATMCPRLPGP